MNGGDMITADIIRGAYCDAAPARAVPSDQDCEEIAVILTRYRDIRIEREKRHARKPDATGLRRMAQAEDVRGAIGTLLRDLPDLAACIQNRPELEDQAHAQSLGDLLDAVRLAAMLWPSLNGSLRRFNPKCRWALTADCIVGTLLMRWRKANPGWRIGKPMSADQPATRLMVKLVGLIEGAEPDAGTVAQHFTRNHRAL